MSHADGPDTPVSYLRLVEGETYADWDAAYLDNVGRLYRLMYSRVGNRPDAEDLTAEVFKAALGLSGTYDLTRFLDGAAAPADYYFSSPGDFLPGLTGTPLEALSAFVRNTNGSMPPYQKAILPDADLADIHSYLQSVPKAPDPRNIPLLNP